MSSTAVMAALGFVYWLVAAHQYTSMEVGLAATLIYVMTFIGLLSQLGLNVGLMRFLPSATDKLDLVLKSLRLVMLTGVFLSIVALIGLRVLTSELIFLQRSVFSAGLFIILMSLAALGPTMDSALIALRRSKYVFWKGAIFGIAKLALIWVLVPFGAFGIFSSWGMAAVLALAASFIMFKSEIGAQPDESYKQREVMGIIRYSAKNYLAAVIGNLPILAIPIILMGLRGSEDAAYFSIAMSVALLLYSIPLAICSSLFAEGSTSSERIRIETLRAVKLMLIILSFAVAFVVVFRYAGLGLFGIEYAENSSDLLVLLALSSPFVAVNTLSWTLLNLKQQVGSIIIAVSFNAGLVISLSLVMIDKGVDGIGLAWLISQAATSAVYIALVLRHYRFSARSREEFSQ